MALVAARYIQHAPHVVDADLAWMHLHSKRTPDARGSAIIHVLRMEDGKFAEHWGVGQPIPEESVHDNSIF